jgi:hypothetical protein
VSLLERIRAERKSETKIRFDSLSLRKFPFRFASLSLNKFSKFSLSLRILENLSLLIFSKNLHPWT